jgi:very-short-patch-repair endonuclease
VAGGGPRCGSDRGAEVASPRWHGSRSSRKDDLARTRQLQRAGWTVVAFAEDDSDDELVHTVATLLVRLAA